MSDQPNAMGAVHTLEDRLAALGLAPPPVHVMPSLTLDEMTRRPVFPRHECNDQCGDGKHVIEFALPPGANKLFVAPPPGKQYQT